MKHFLFVLITTASLFSLILTHSTQGKDFNAPQESEVKRACSQSESWKLSSRVRPDWKKKFNLFLDKKQGTLEAFSSAFTMRKLAKNPEEKLLSEYWMSRIFFRRGLIHSAYRGWSTLSTQPQTSLYPSFLVATLDCLTLIHKNYPSLSLPVESSRHIFSTLSRIKKKSIQNSLWQAAVLISISTPRPLPFKISDKAGVYSVLYRGIEALKRKQSTLAIQNLEAYFSHFVHKNKAPKIFKKYHDSLRINLARAYYKARRYQKAAHHYGLIQKDSNLLIEALIEKSWAHLMNRDYRSSIGASANLISGNLAQAFSAEGISVMAMAFNELCQFPRAIQAINILRSKYQPSYQWLQSKQSKSAGYRQVIEYIQGNPNIKVPDEVGTEWIRSPLFLSNQKELNLTYQEVRTLKKVNRTIVRDRVRFAKTLLKKVYALKKDYRLAKIRLKPGQRIPQELTDRLSHIQVQYRDYKRMRAATPFWFRFTEYQSKKNLKTRSTLISQVNQEVATINRRLRQKLRSVSENAELIEVEILNGSTGDLIWKNIQPKYKQALTEAKKRLKNRQDAKVWNWGNIQFEVNSQQEIWEDELGTFQANLVNHCETKEKFIKNQRNLAGKKARK